GGERSEPGEGLLAISLLPSPASDLRSSAPSPRKAGRGKKEGEAPALLRPPAAVDPVDRAGDRRSGIAAEEHRERADILGRRVLQHRLLLGDEDAFRLLERLARGL